MKNGDYIPSAEGGFEKASGAEAAAERLALRLKTPKGSFAPLPDFGSRLYLLAQRPASDLEASAGQYILEAVNREEGMKLLESSVKSEKGRLQITCRIEYMKETETVKLWLE